MTVARLATPWRRDVGVFAAIGIALVAAIIALAAGLSVQPRPAVIEDLTITSAAQHGSISPRGRTGVIYRAHGNYRGEDSFALALRGRAGSSAGVAIIRVQVDVR